MKRILLPAGGAVLATGLLAAGLAGTAQADTTVSTDPLAATAAKAAETLEFWSKSDYAALKGAVAFNPDALEVSKISSGGGYSADTKPGQAEPIGGEKKSVSKVQNVNNPKTTGKVFFEGRDGKLYWCSGTSIQSQYRNLVATAGHCAYDIAANDEVVSRWVFVPGYYQGKAPFGIYVGKQAFTHYDFDVYEDFDRDYAFVTVYDGIGGTINKPKQVDWATYKAYQGEKGVKDVTVTEDEYKKGKLDPKTTDYYDVDPGKADEATGPDFPGAVVDRFEVSKGIYDAAGVGQGNGKKFGEPVVENVTASDAEAYAKKQRPSWRPGQPFPTPTRDYPATVGKDARGNWTITHYYVQKWYKQGSVARYVRLEPFIVGNEVKSIGRLGDVVGGQGFAYNQPTGKDVRVFGYPYGPHLDGNKPFTGVTPKWCYGKTDKNVIRIPSKKVEEQMSLKCAVTAGYDGAPWLYKYSNAKRLGYVNGVTSLIADTDNNKRYDRITSPYFDGETNTVYKAAAASWSGKLIP
ncbi:trypsin-like serine peptidase [Nonomuraea purpurea]|uniref:Trypsin-like serine peptidase n=1 Tax=Nonomuraea purpurea TaxID=1849276 RepID=A0ABV8GEK2_9ACTN